MKTRRFNPSMVSKSNIKPIIHCGEYLPQVGPCVEAETTSMEAYNHVHKDKNSYGDFIRTLKD